MNVLFRGKLRNTSHHNFIMDFISLLRKTAQMMTKMNIYWFIWGVKGDQAEHSELAGSKRESER